MTEDTTSDDYNYALIISILLIFISILLFLYNRHKKTSRSSILLTGLCGSGKTLLYSQLLHGKHVQTHTSIKENIGNYIIKKKTLKIVDIPGHERLRDKYFDAHRLTARGIVFVIDSVNLQRDVRDVAEYLFNILVDNIIIKNRVEILILCNKQDQTYARGSNSIKYVLEKELNALRVTKMNQLESVDPKVKKSTILGDINKDFNFSKHILKIDFAESSAYNRNTESANIENFKQWLHDLV